LKTNKVFENALKVVEFYKPDLKIARENNKICSRQRDDKRYIVTTARPLQCTGKIVNNVHFLYAHIIVSGRPQVAMQFVTFLNEIYNEL